MQSARHAIGQAGRQGRREGGGRVATHRQFKVALGSSIS